MTWRHSFHLYTKALQYSTQTKVRNRTALHQLRLDTPEAKLLSARMWLPWIGWADPEKKVFEIFSNWFSITHDSHIGYVHPVDLKAVCHLIRARTNSPSLAPVHLVQFQMNCTAGGQHLYGYSCNSHPPARSMMSSREGNKLAEWVTLSMTKFQILPQTFRSLSPQQPGRTVFLYVRNRIAA
jgi:hypothetical protein